MGEFTPSKCRSCGAKIMWVKTKKGKNMPIDYDPELEHLWADAEEPVRADSARGRRQPVKPEFDPGNMTSHFETCPNAEDHRR